MFEIVASRSCKRKFDGTRRTPWKNRATTSRPIERTRPLPDNRPHGQQSLGKPGLHAVAPAAASIAGQDPAAIYAAVAPGMHGLFRLPALDDPIHRSHAAARHTDRDALVVSDVVDERDCRRIH